MTDEPTDGLKAVVDFWSAQGKAALDGMQALFGGEMPAANRATSPELAQAGEATMQLWSAAEALSAELANRLGQATGSSGATKAMLERVIDPSRWMQGHTELDEALARTINGPLLSDFWDFERRYSSVVRRWTELRQRAFEHQRVVLDAWIKAGRQYSAELAGRSLEPKQAVALWTEIGNRHLLEAQRSEPFLRSQREMIRASTEFRLAQAELSEAIGRQFGWPTRTELDDVHRSVTEMRRELRKVRRELDAARQVVPPAPPEAPPAPRATKSRASAARRREAR
ncbi:MAG: poly(R)-hydroxyalkanoic acid synthase subunit PhaE [Acetobacteraceae bacterium]|nr:poly(R)-hydroxyalkanoic acid synthase subunit PhaE [Acetobacteraceae bacterium]